MSSPLLPTQAPSPEAPRGDEEDEYAPLMPGGGGGGGDQSGAAGGSGGSGGGGDTVEALRAQLAAQQALLNDVLRGNASPSAALTAAASAAATPMPGFGHVPSPTSAAAASAASTTGAASSGAGGGSSAVAGDVTGAAAPQSDAELAALLSSQEGINTASLIDPDVDAQLARDMQQMEMMLAAQERGREEPEEPPSLEDPVWGKFVAPAEGHKPHQVLCISMCPCCIGPYCSTERKGIYKKVALTASFILSAAQLALVVGSLFFRGFAPPKVNPMLGPWPDTLDLMGAKNAAKIKYDYELWRLLTPMMLHAGFVHLLTNLVMQLRLAIFLEVQWGLRKFIALYVASGFFSAVFSTVFIPGSIGVGASGALMGILGAWFVDILASWSEGDANARQQRSFMLVMCFVNMLVILGFSMVPMIDWAAHAFGMLGGLLLNMFLCRNKVQGRWHLILKYGGLGLFITMLVGALIYIFTDAFQPPKVLLHICDEMQRAFPDKDLRC